MMKEKNKVRYNIHGQKELSKRVLKFSKNYLSVLGIVFLIIIIVGCLIAPLLSRYKYDEVNIALGAIPPSLEHWFGTDKLGRDLFVRCMVGGRYSIFIGVSSAILSAGLGVLFGAVSGYFGGKVDSVIIRITEIFQSFPQMVLAMIMVAVIGRSIGNLLVIFTVTGWMQTARLVRNDFLAVKGETFVQVSVAFGIPRWKIIIKEILPNIFTPIVVSTTAIIPGYILAEASLSFLGVGVSDSIPTWGNIMNAATSIGIIKNYWWIWSLPASILILFVLSMNFFGDGLRDLMDPR